MLLAIFSVVVFATLAGTLGAYFLNGAAAHEASDQDATLPNSPPSSSDRQG